MYLLILLLSLTTPHQNPQKNVSDVDWGEVSVMVHVYLCTGQNSWIESIPNETVRRVYQVVNLFTCAQHYNAYFRQYLRSLNNALAVKTFKKVDEKCYLRGYLVLLNRLGCCRQLGEGIKRASEAYVTSECTTPRDSLLCLTASYLKHHQTTQQFYSLTYKFKICRVCPRKRFSNYGDISGYIAETLHQHLFLTHRSRTKRVFDLNALLVVLSQITKLQIHDMDISEGPGDTLKMLLFMTEGILSCYMEKVSRAGAIRSK